MKKIVYLTLLCFLTGCTDAENMFYTDEKCNGIPDLFERFVVDKERQTVLMQVGSVYGKEIKEENAMYFDSCTVTDTKNFVCNVKSLNYQFAMSNGTLIKTDKSHAWKTEDCTYKKSFFGYKKIADATVKDTKSLPLQNK